MSTALLILAGLYLLSQTQGGFFSQAPIATPGTQIGLPGGFGLNIPAGMTYHLANGDTVTPMPALTAGPAGWVYGVLGSNGQPVWLNTATGQVSAATLWF